VGRYLLLSTSVKRLNLGNNSFSGEIPKELGTLPKLQNLMLASNMLAGEIPWSLCTRRFLRYVNLANNALSGGIPHSLATSSSLTVLNLTMNKLSGMIPASLFNDSSQLVVSDLGGNLFSGPIPDFHRMATLQVLRLAKNNLSGKVKLSVTCVIWSNSSHEFFIPQSHLLLQLRRATPASLGFGLGFRG
jgi:Leucine-rich repeat (LRR) protein